jgi:hypothetical protein
MYTLAHTHACTHTHIDTHTHTHTHTHKTHNREHISHPLPHAPFPSPRTHAHTHTHRHGAARVGDGAVLAYRGGSGESVSDLSDCGHGVPGTSVTSRGCLHGGPGPGPKQQVRTRVCVCMWVWECVCGPKCVQVILCVCVRAQIRNHLSALTLLVHA